MATGTTAARAVPRSAPRGPLLGDLNRLRKDPLGLFAEAASRGEDVVRFRAAHRAVFLTVGPEAIAHVGIRNRDNYAKGVSYDALRVPLPNALLTIDGEEARRRRKLLMPLFTRRSLLDEVPTMVAAVDALCERWDGLARDGTEFDLYREMNRLTFDVVGRILVGAELGDDMGRLESHLAEASDWVARRTRALVPLPPSVPTRRNAAYRRAYREVITWADELVAARRAAASNGAAARMVAARDEDGPGLDDGQLRDEVTAFLMAGYQTTACALSWSWYLMTRHHDVQERFAQAAAIAFDDGPPEAARLDVVPYLGQVLDESMRLYPPGWAFTRTPIEDDEVCGLRVPAGSIVIVASYANHHATRFWHDPERFDPERFAPGRRESIPAYAYFPFGVGPHACIGKHLAEMEAKLALAMLARRYRVEAASTEPVPATPAITLTPARPIRVRVTRR
jgi:cytochrome P450